MIPSKDKVAELLSKHTGFLVLSTELDVFPDPECKMLAVRWQPTDADDVGAYHFLVPDSLNLDQIEDVEFTEWPPKVSRNPNPFC